MSDFLWPPWTASCQSPLSSTISWSLLKIMLIELMVLSSVLILCYLLILLPLVFPSIRDFSIELTPHIRWENYWSFSFSISSLDEYSGLISFRNNKLDFFAVQGTLRSLLQDHSSETSIFQCSASFMVQFSHLYMTKGKIIDLTIQKFVG